MYQNAQKSTEKIEKCSYNFNLPSYNALVHGQHVDGFVSIVIKQNIKGRGPSIDPPNTVFDKLPPICHLM